MKKILVYGGGGGGRSARVAGLRENKRCPWQRKTEREGGEAGGGRESIAPYRNHVKMYNNNETNNKTNSYTNGADDIINKSEYNKRMIIRINEAVGVEQGHGVSRCFLSPGLRL